MSFTVKNIKISGEKDYFSEFYLCNFSVHFKIDIPYNIAYRPEIKVNQFVTDNNMFLYFWKYLALNIINFICSVILLITSFIVIKNIIYISDVITRPEKLDKNRKLIVLDFNHCRFIGKTTFKKKILEDSKFKEILAHLRSLNLSFYFSAAHYVANIVLCFIAFYDVFTTGIVSNLQLIFLCVCVFLGCADVSTIFVYDSKFNIFKNLVDKNAKNIVYFVIGSLIVFIIMVFILFTFFQYEERFESLTDCVSVLLGLVLADSVLDIFSSIDGYFGKFFIFCFVLVFHLSFLQIFLTLVANSFQKAKEEFKQIEQIKKEKAKLIIQQSKKGIKKFKSNTKTEHDLKEEFFETYVKSYNKKSIFRKSKTIKQKKEEDNQEESNIQRNNSNPNSPKKREILDFTNEPLKEQKTFFLKQEQEEEYNDEIEHEINSFIKNKIRKGSDTNFTNIDRFEEKKKELEVLENSTIVDKAIRNFTFKIAIIIKYNYELLTKYFTEFEYLKNKEEFSFILVIASSELCDNLLKNLRNVQRKIRAIKKSF